MVKQILCMQKVPDSFPDIFSLKVQTIGETISAEILEGCLKSEEETVQNSFMYLIKAGTIFSSFKAVLSLQHNSALVRLTYLQVNLLLVQLATKSFLVE